MARIKIPYIQVNPKVLPLHTRFGAVPCLPPPPQSFVSLIELVIRIHDRFRNDASGSVRQSRPRWTTSPLPMCGQITYQRSHVVYLPASLKGCENPIHHFMPRPSGISRGMLDSRLIWVITSTKYRIDRWSKEVTVS